MRVFALLFVGMLLACTSSEVTRLPPLSPDEDKPGILPGIADSGLISPTIDTRLPNQDTKQDSQIGKRDTQPEQSHPDLPPGLAGTCDLLKQNCVSKAEACYPVTGKGEARCLPAGSVGEGGSCYVGADTPQCDLGLTCVQDVMQGGVCLLLCDVFDAINVCGMGSACQPLPFFTKVGFCHPG